jgi:hypothetical protein
MRSRAFENTASLTCLAGLLMALLAAPSVARAQPDAGIFDYGLRGLLDGAQLGLAAGFLSTGDRYDSGEWRKLVFGTGIGALAGLGLGLALGVADTSREPPRTGWYVLRDVSSGTLIGALAGMAVGALFLIDSGRPKNLLTGAAVGTLIGGAAGIAFGLIESGNESRHAHAAVSGPSLSLAVFPRLRAELPLAGVTGKF